MEQETYTKEDAYHFMCKQDLVYNGLDEHFDQWFNEHVGIYFEYVDDDTYVRIEEEKDYKEDA
jgi:hypothetical protein